MIDGNGHTRMDAAPAAYRIPIETPTGRRVARWLLALDPVARRQHAAILYDDRRADLALYRQLLIERDGRAPSLDRIEARDRVLAELTALATA